MAPNSRGHYLVRPPTKTYLSRDNMTENTDQDLTEATIPDELELLKARADLLQISYHPNIGLDKLKNKVANAMAGEVVPDAPVSANPKAAPRLFMTHDEYKNEQRNMGRKNVNRLVRCNVSCMNPDKSEWLGEIISVGSSKLGTFKKYVPFNIDGGYHIPYIIYEALKERKYTTYTTVKGNLGQKVRKGKLTNEFNIQVLPPLTSDELKDLKQQQAMSGSTAD